MKYALIHTAPGLDRPTVWGPFETYEDLLAFVLDRRLVGELRIQPILFGEIA